MSEADIIYSESEVSDHEEHVSTSEIYRSVRNKYTKPKDEVAQLPVSQPLQLVRVEASGRFAICEHAASIISQLEGRIGVVSVGGPSRTGKSLLLNMLVSGHGGGFPVGDTTNACTQGIWLWGEPLAIPGMNILVLDSEGSNSRDRSEAHDGKIFALLILLSSIFVYNSIGTIDEKSVNKLTLASYLSSILTMRANDDDPRTREKLASMAPKFIWLLRDFHLELRRPDNTPMTAKQYLEAMLGEQPLGRRSEKFYEARDLLLKIFADRDCFTLPRPVATEKQLQRLATATKADLRPNFVQDFEHLRCALVDECGVKKFEGTEMTGKTLLGLLHVFVDSINSGAVPNIKNSWATVLQTHFDAIFQEMLEIFHKKKKVDLAAMPLEETEISARLQQAKDRALSLLRGSSLKDAELERSVTAKLEEIYLAELNELLEVNRQASEAHNFHLITRIFKPVINRLDTEAYAENFEQLDSDWAEALREYEKQAKGPGKFAALSEFTRIHQHQAFSNFFSSVTRKYETLIENERRKVGEAEERMRDAQRTAAEQAERRQQIIAHVRIT